MLSAPTIATRPARRTCTPPARRRRGLAASAQRVTVELTPQAVEQIATRVAQLLRHQRQHEPNRTTEPGGLLTVGQLATHLGLSRAWVYEHAQELGAIRTGDGPKARMRFDLHTAAEALKRHGRHAPTPTASPKARRAPARPESYPADAPLLEVRRREIRGVRSCFAAWHGRIGAV
jgi:hypothetical protein